MTSPGHSQNPRPIRHKSESLPGACLVCGGDLLGTREHYFVCTTCNLTYSEENLMKAGKLKRRRVVRRRPVQQTENSNSSADPYYAGEFSQDT